MQLKNNLHPVLQYSRFSRGIILVALLIFSGCIKAQQSAVPLNYDWLQDVEGKIVQNRGFLLNNYLMNYEADSTIRALVKMNDKGIVIDPVAIIFPLHSSMRPWLEQGHPVRKNILYQNSTNEHHIFNTQDRWPEWFLKYHSKNSLVNVERKAQDGEPLLRLYVDPLLNLEGMHLIHNDDDHSGGRFYVNTRGITAHGDIGTKISFETSFYENQAFYPHYIKSFANTKLIIPGQGRWKPFKNTGYDYAMSMGYISYSPCRNFNVQIGTGKHFVGDGYRSLLLSDNSFPYPFARLTGWFGPNKMFQYTTIYASLMNLHSVAPVPMGTERLYQKKAASFYQLSVNIGRIAEVSLFQGLIWSAADLRNKQCIQLAYVNPLIFSSVPFYGLNDKHNFLLGATFHVDLFKTMRLYGQFVADDFGAKRTVANKTGFQLGVKYFNVGHIKHFNLEMEYNQVNPYTYSAGDSAQAYTHYNQPLAHPLGANFSELIISGYYKLGDFYANARFSGAVIGADTSGFDFGQNAFISDLNANSAPSSGAIRFGQGRRTTLTYFDASIGYMISYASNLNFCIGITDRNLSTDATFNHTQFVYVAIRTSLTNNYLDFFWR